MKTKQQQDQPTIYGPNSFRKRPRFTKRNVRRPQMRWKYNIMKIAFFIMLHHVMMLKLDNRERQTHKEIYLGLPILNNERNNVGCERERKMYQIKIYKI